MAFNRDHINYGSRKNPKGPPSLSAQAVGSTAGCKVNCGHTEREHEAFDTGVRAGELGIDAEDYPLWWDKDMREAWLTGHSVGALNRSR